MTTPNTSPTQGFTLIELLVVISIVALLIGILLPALSRARKAAQVSVCGQNLRQIATSMTAYAIDHDGNVLRGPSATQTLFGPVWGTRSWSQIATNQIYISTNWMPLAPGTNADANLHAAGILLHGDYVSNARSLYCPADDSYDPVHELEKVKNRHNDPTQDAFCSYFFRQLDQTSKDKMEDLGHNGAGIAATALAMDANSKQVDPLSDFHRTNHDAELVNIVYLDGHVTNHANLQDEFGLSEADTAAFPNGALSKLDLMFTRADYALEGDPLSAPVPTMD